MLRERLEEPNRPVIQSAWQDIELVWRVVGELVARMDVGGMGPLVAQALDPRRMTLARKDVANMRVSPSRSMSGGLTATSS